MKKTLLLATVLTFNFSSFAQDPEPVVEFSIKNQTFDTKLKEDGEASIETEDESRIGVDLKFKGETFEVNLESEQGSRYRADFEASETYKKTDLVTAKSGFKFLASNNKLNEKPSLKTKAILVGGQVDIHTENFEMHTGLYAGPELEEGAKTELVEFGAGYRLLGDIKAIADFDYTRRDESSVLNAKVGLESKVTPASKIKLEHIRRVIDRDAHDGSGDLELTEDATVFTGTMLF